VGRKVRTGFTALVVVVLIAGGIAVGARALWRAAQRAVHADGCEFGSTSLDLGQSTVASTMVSVVIKRDLPERAAVLVIGAALQESKLRNIPSGEGDRDSVGVLQQRPSQGWGTAEQLSDIHFATAAFLDALVKVPNWQNGEFAATIQRVQISAEGGAYARHAERAQAIADALLGNDAAGVTCTFSEPTLVAEANLVATRLASDLPISTPAVSGNSIIVPGAGWATAAWLVTHADQYGIGSVRYSGKEWIRNKGWHDKDDVSPDQVEAVMAKSS